MFASSRSSPNSVQKAQNSSLFLELLDGPNATCYVYVYDDSTTRTELLLNYDPQQITVHARLLGHSVLPRSTGRLEPEMF